MNDEIRIGECKCETCGTTYDFEASGAEYPDMCPGCQAQQEERERAEAYWADAIDEAQGEVDEAEGELESLLDELRDLKEKVKQAREDLKFARAKLARLEKNGL